MLRFCTGRCGCCGGPEGAWVKGGPPLLLLVPPSPQLRSSSPAVARDVSIFWFTTRTDFLGSFRAWSRTWLSPTIFKASVFLHSRPSRDPCSRRRRSSAAAISLGSFQHSMSSWCQFWTSCHVPSSFFRQRSLFRQMYRQAYPIFLHPYCQGSRIGIPGRLILFLNEKKAAVA